MTSTEFTAETIYEITIKVWGAWGFQSLRKVFEDKFDAEQEFEFAKHDQMIVQAELVAYHRTENGQYRWDRDSRKEYEDENANWYVDRLMAQGWE